MCKKCLVLDLFWWNCWKPIKILVILDKNYPTCCTSTQYNLVVGRIQKSRPRQAAQQKFGAAVCGGLRCHNWGGIRQGRIQGRKKRGREGTVVSEILVVVYHFHRRWITNYKVVHWFVGGRKNVRPRRSFSEREIRQGAQLFVDRFW